MAGTVSDVTVWMGLVGTAFVLTAVGVAAYELTEGRKGKETGEGKRHPRRRSRSGDRFERLKQPFRDPLGVS